MRCARGICGFPEEKILEQRKLRDGRLVLKVKDKFGAGDFKVVICDPRTGKKFTPKHAHFAIDLYGKLCRDECLTRQLLEAISKVYNGQPAFAVIADLEKGGILRHFDQLPGYKTDYILHCLELIFEQEDVNFERRGGQLPRLRRILLRKGLASEEEVKRGRFLAWRLFRRIVVEGIHPVEAMLEAGLRI